LGSISGIRAKNGVDTRESRPAPDDDENVEETPEQVLARLVRYRDSLHPDALNRDGSPNGAPASRVMSVGTAPRPPAPALRARTPGPDARAAAKVAEREAEAEAVGALEREWRYSSESKWGQIRSAVPATVFGQFLAVLTCTLTLVAFEQFDATVAIALVAAGAAVGVLAAVRRIPLALWWTFGIVLGGVLGRWS
jgi:hypothetical protein